MKRFFILLFIVATFSVAGHSQGYHYDVNGDGSVTSYDITALYNYLLNNDMTYYSTSDINGDGEVTAADVTAVYDILLGGNPGIVDHEYVDLGLPSGTLWATMNIGASSPEDYGDHFAWGETTPKYVNEWSTYKWCNGNYDTLTKYCTLSNYGYNGFTDGKTELDSEDDAATANWGPQWRMPSPDQIQELRDNCASEWTTVNGVNGLLFTSMINGAALLFLPAAADRWDISLYDVGSWGGYWSRTLVSDEPDCAFGFYFDSDGVYWSLIGRAGDRSVRAVHVQ